MHIIAATQKGVYKTENEDRVLIGDSIIDNGAYVTDFKEGVIAIADGVGGNKAGAVASQFVVDQLRFSEQISEQTLVAINDALIKKSESNSQLERMGTTLSGISFSQSKTVLFSIGNTRVYYLQGSKYLKQITTDDTTMQYLLSTGQLSAESAVSFERKNEITACFGGGNSNLFKIKVRKTEPIHTPFIITSDGIHDYLSVDCMEELIQEFAFTKELCFQMIKLARRNGSVDDASIIVGFIN